MHPSAAPDPSAQPSQPEEVSLVDVVLALARHRRLIVGMTVGGVVVGLMLALLSTPVYTASATLVRETESSEGLSGLGGFSMLRGLGINLGMSSTGLTPQAYPDIVRSREVRLAVVRDTFYIPPEGRVLTFIDYLETSGGWVEVVKAYTIGLPGTVMRALKEPSTHSTAGRTDLLTEEEDQALEQLAGMLSVSEDFDTGLMRIAVTTPYPTLSAEMTARVVDHLADRVRTIRTQKARSDLAFVEQRYEEAELELRDAEADLAQFDDRNRNPSTAQLRTNRERLVRQVSFKAQLFSELQTQRTQAEIALQRSEPILTVLERPLAPVRPNGPSRRLLVLGGLFLGLLLGIGTALVRTALTRQRRDPTERRKLDEIRAALLPKRARSTPSSSDPSVTSEPHA